MVVTLVKLWSPQMNYSFPTVTIIEHGICSKTQAINHIARGLEARLVSVFIYL